MNKTALIAQREFLTRVRKKTFVLTTILLPLLFFGFYALIIYFSVKGDDNYRVAVVDKSNIFGKKIDTRDKEIVFEFLDGDTTEAKRRVQNKEFDAFLYIPTSYDLLANDSLELRSDKTIGLMTRDNIEKRVNTALQDRRFEILQIPKAKLDSAQKDSQYKYRALNGSTEGQAGAGISYAVGYISGFLIYIVLFIYGAMVMRGVMEEKVNRIAEVIVSSAKPFQLMMGKIIGIGSVGLVQFLIWIILITGLQLLLPFIFPGLVEQAHNMPMQPGAMQGAQAMQNNSAMSGFLKNLGQVNWPLIGGSFLFYFLFGYLLYSSLFAAVGSAVNEDPQDAQSLMLPITLPIIFAIVIMTKAVNNPNSPLAVFGSLFPLTSPIVMMARIAHGIPEGVTVTELFLSGIFLIAGFLGTTWVAAKIYRTGILLYGKKVTWKEMWKWAIRKN